MAAPGATAPRLVGVAPAVAHGVVRRSAHAGARRPVAGAAAVRCRRGRRRRSRRTEVHARPRDGVDRARVGTRAGGCRAGPRAASATADRVDRLAALAPLPARRGTPLHAAGRAHRGRQGPPRRARSIARRSRAGGAVRCRAAVAGRPHRAGAGHPAVFRQLHAPTERRRRAVAGRRDSAADRISRPAAKLVLAGAGPRRR